MAPADPRRHQPRTVTGGRSAAPYAQRLRFADIKALADTIQAPPRQWTPERLWKAYETLDSCFEPKLIVEIDGGQHAEDLEADAHRTAFLEHTGYRVLRFWNHEVLQSIEVVMERIDDEVHGLRRVSGGRAKQG